ncbi:MAG: hypothetical protein GKR89_04370 [Candidatus Latescibacteria bacterium]|nr:hypothetical protein [Candidatus Latescibacterota bacterium]
MKYYWLCLVLLACSDPQSAQQAPSAPQLQLIASRKLVFSEPSGLALGASGDELWAVGNNPERVYRMTAAGRLLATLPYEGDDLEGITFDPQNNTLWIAEEEQRSIVQLDQDGLVLRTVFLELGGQFNNGLEGITLDGAGGLHLLNEKNPGLFISLAADLTIETQYRLDFAQDYSGLAHDRRRDRFWILSHEDGMLYLWSQSEGVSASYPMPFAKIEGIAVDNDRQRLYLVSELDDSLRTYALNEIP